jgi:hypothetical protein
VEAKVPVLIKTESSDFFLAGVEQYIMGKCSETLAVIWRSRGFVC